jgi:hypothetical protein
MQWILKKWEEKLTPTNLMQLFFDNNLLSKFNFELSDIYD